MNKSWGKLNANICEKIWKWRKVLFSLMLVVYQTKWRRFYTLWHFRAYCGWLERSSIKISNKTCQQHYRLCFAHRVYKLFSRMTCDVRKLLFRFCFPLLLCKSWWKTLKVILKSPWMSFDRHPCISTMGKSFQSIFTGKLSSYFFQYSSHPRLYQYLEAGRYNSNLSEAENSIARKVYLLRPFFPFLAQQWEEILS